VRRSRKTGKLSIVRSCRFAVEFVGFNSGGTMAQTKTLSPPTRGAWIETIIGRAVKGRLTAWKDSNLRGSARTPNRTSGSELTKCGPRKEIESLAWMCLQAAAKAGYRPRR
jgi:hypothetical protein